MELNKERAHWVATIEGDLNEEEWLHALNELEFLNLEVTDEKWIGL